MFWGWIEFLETNFHISEDEKQHWEQQGYRKNKEDIISIKFRISPLFSNQQSTYLLPWLNHALISFYF